MIKINNLNRDLSSLSSIHWSNLKSFLVDRIRSTSYQAPELPKRKSEKAKHLIHTTIANNNWEAFRDHLLKDGELKKIILCEPSGFTALHNSLVKDFAVNCYVAHVKKLFDYEKFSDGILLGPLSYGAFDLIKALKIPVCPYCNRQYISIIEKGILLKSSGRHDQLRPPLDHFYSQSEYPEFSLSFYNLIPCCSFCNSNLKGQASFATETHVHPYEMEFGDRAVFSYYRDMQPSVTLKPKCGVSDDNRVIESIKEFELEKLYDENHRDLAEEIYMKRLENSHEHFNSIKRIFESAKFGTPSAEAFYRFYFGNYMQKDDFEKRPLAKFTYDLVNQFDIMKNAGY